MVFGYSQLVISKDVYSCENSRRYHTILNLVNDVISY